MSRSSTLITLGILIALSPFLGLPHAWLVIVLPVLGFLTLLIGYLLRKGQVAATTETPIAPFTSSNDTPSAVA
jgi:ABC-type xylose transport system permease subunit